MRIARVWRLAGIAAVMAAMGLGGCCDPDKETCKIVKARALRLADTITLCCTISDTTTRDTCLNDVKKTSDELEQIIRDARQACRDENWNRAKQLMDELEKKWKEWERLHPAVIPIPALPSGNGNSSAPVGSTESFLFNFDAAAEDASVTTVIETSEGTFLPEAVGAGVVAASGGSTVTAVVPAQVVSTLYTIGSGATVVWNTDGETLTYDATGSVSLGDWTPQPSGGSQALPTDLQLKLTRQGRTILLSLDTKYAGNKAVISTSNVGHLWAAVDVTVSDQIGRAHV